jgi:hypothetical protein
LGEVAARERVVLDLTGDDSEGEDVAAALGAEEAEQLTAPPDEAVPKETDLEQSGAPSVEAARGAGEQDAPPEEVPRLAAATSAAPAVSASQGEPDVTALESDAAGMLAQPFGDAAAQDQAEAAAQAPGVSEPPAALPAEQAAAEDAGKDAAPVGEPQALVGPAQAVAPATSGALLVARPTVPAPSKGKEPVPQETLPEASSGSSLGDGVKVAASESGEGLTWRHRRTRETLFKLEPQQEEAEEEAVDRAVQQLADGFTALGESHLVRFLVVLNVSSPGRSSSDVLIDAEVVGAQRRQERVPPWRRWPLHAAGGEPEGSPPGS